MTLEVMKITTLEKRRMKMGAVTMAPSEAKKDRRGAKWRNPASGR